MSGTRPIAIVTDALWRKSVSAIRALGTAGYRVFALGDSVLTTGFHSRHTTRHFRGPTAATCSAGFGETLVRAITAAQGDPIAILPMEDATCEWMLRFGSRLPSNARTLLPDVEAFETARDKGRTIGLAERCDVPCPRSLAPDSVQELRRLIEAHGVVDLIVKPRTGSGSSGILYGEQIAGKALDRHWAEHGPLLLQERVPAEGAAVGVSLLYDGAGRHRASFAHRRLRQYPVSGGPSTQRKSIALDDLATMSRKLLETLAWKGVAMVEWKIHPRTGDPFLIEINPRFWGSLALAVRSGVDFPTLYANAVLDRPLPATPPEYKAGLICRWLMPGDLLRYLGEPSERRESLREFLRGSITDSEEFDASDIRGSLACFVCPALLATRPQYWRYLRRTKRSKS